MTIIQSANPHFKIVLVDNPEYLPAEIIDKTRTSLIVIRHPIFADSVGLFETVIVSYNEDSVIDEVQTEKNLRLALRSSHIDFIDVMNVEFYSKFERPIIAIVTNHPSVDDLSKNQPFFKALAQFLYEGGLSKHPEFDYAIINALEIRDISHDFQLDEFFPERNFFLTILKDVDTGYLYDSIIIRENEKMPMVMTADTIDEYISNYTQGKLQVYLRSETSDSSITFNSEGILQVYGSNFISVVNERKYAPVDEKKGLLLMFLKQDCPRCAWSEAFFDRLFKLIGNETFIFAKMDIDKNYPTSDLRKHIYPEEGLML